MAADVAAEGLGADGIASVDAAAAVVATAGVVAVGAAAAIAESGPGNAAHNIASDSA
jgi:hypothetical protein